MEAIESERDLTDTRNVSVSLRELNKEMDRIREGRLDRVVRPVRFEELDAQWVTFQLCKSSKGRQKNVVNSTFAIAANAIV